MAQQERTQPQARVQREIWFSSCAWGGAVNGCNPQACVRWLAPSVIC